MLALKAIIIQTISNKVFGPKKSTELRKQKCQNEKNHLFYLDFEEIFSPTVLSWCKVDIHK